MPPKSKRTTRTIRMISGVPMKRMGIRKKKQKLNNVVRKRARIRLDGTELGRDVDALWALGDTFAASDAMVGTTEWFDSAVVADEERTAGLAVSSHIGVVGDDIIVVEAFVEVGEIARDVDAVRAWHTVAAGGAGDIGEFDVLVGEREEHSLFVVGERSERGEGADIILKMFEIGHAAEDREDTRL